MYRIGIDLGGTNIAAGVVDESQHIVAEVSVPTGAERGAEAVVADICRAAELAMARAGITAAHCASIGIGSPGTCDGSRGVVVRAYNLGWFNVPVCDMVTARLGLPCRLSNDANCAALAETVAGAAVGCRNMVLVTLGTGVGVGIVSDGKLLEGVGGTGAEAEAALAQGGSGQQQLDALNALWQEPQGYLHIVISHEELDEAEALLAQAEAMAAQGDSQSLYPVLAELRGQFRLIAETQRVSAKNIF